jgi:hypothetical protein
MNGARKWMLIWAESIRGGRVKADQQEAGKDGELVQATTSKPVPVTEM